MPLVASALSRAVTAARSSAVAAPSPSAASSSSTAGTSASSSVLSPRSVLPRCLMPSIGGAQRGDHVVRARIRRRQLRAGAQERRAPDRPRRAADPLGEDERGLLQQAAGVARTRGRPSRSGRSRSRARASSRSPRRRRPRRARRSTSRCRPPSGRSSGRPAPPGSAPCRSYSLLLWQGFAEARLEVGERHLVARPRGAAVGEHARRLARVAEARDDEHRLAHVLVGRVAARP